MIFQESDQVFLFIISEIGIDIQCFSWLYLKWNTFQIFQHWDYVGVSDYCLLYDIFLLFFT